MSVKSSKSAKSSSVKKNIAPKKTKITHFDRLYEQAEEYTTLNNWVCVPLEPGTKCPKYPGWNKTTETNFDIFYPDRKGLGVICGKVSGITVVDIDISIEGKDKYAGFDNFIPIWEKIMAYYQRDGFTTPTVQTPSGGFHYYFQHEDLLPSGSAKINVKLNGTKGKAPIDIKNDGGHQVVAPPSIYFANKPEKKKFEGLEYDWITEYDVPLQKMPKWLYGLCSDKSYINIDGDKINIMFNTVHTNPPIQPKILTKTTKSVKITENNAENNADDITDTKYPTLTFEQVELMVNNLNKARFASYDDWCKLVWVIARWSKTTEDETGDEIEDEVIDMLDTYCAECPDYTDGCVEKWWRQAFKKANKVATMGTLIMWLKEDSIETFREIFKRNSNIEVSTISTFNHKDVYCWIDFIEQFSGTFKTQRDLNKELAENLPRVLAFINIGKGHYYKKDNCEDNLYSNIEKPNGEVDIDLRYVVKKSKVDKKTKTEIIFDETITISLSKYIKENRKLFPQFNRVNCHPNNPPKGCFNMWQGFVAERVPVVDMLKIERLLLILREIWANGNDELYRYLLAWFKMTVAEPEKMAKVALFMYSSAEGAGKGTVVEFLSNYVLGDRLVSEVAGVQTVVDKHYNGLKGRKLLVINEMASTRDEFRHNFDLIKPIITDPKLKEEEKFKNPEKINNLLNVIMMTNNKDSLYLPSDQNRRFVCFECSNKYAGNTAALKKWWKETRELIMNQDAGNHFYTYLMDLDTTDYPDPMVVIDTNLRREIITISKDNVLRFADILPEILREKIMNGSSTYDIDDGMSATEIFKLYKEWCIEGNEHPKTATKFGITIKPVVENKRVGNGIKYYPIIAEIIVNNQ